MLDGDRLNPTVFGHQGLPLTPIFQCLLNSKYWADGWTPNSYMRPCNGFGCNWYGDNSCLALGCFVLLDLLLRKKAAWYA
jgi:hypothetical protein